MAKVTESERERDEMECLLLLQKYLFLSRHED